jgi:hypothetical protein
MTHFKTMAAAAALSVTAATAHAASVVGTAFQGDVAFNDICSATDAGAGGSGNTACEFGVGEIRFGNGALSGDRELGINDPTGAPDAQGQFAWASGTPYAFSFMYDLSAGEFVLDVGGTAISATAPSLAGANALFIRTRDRNATNFIALTNLALNGHAVPNAGALGGFSADPEYVQVSGIDFASDWSLTGDVTFTDDGSSRGSSPAAQFKVTNVAPVPLPAAGWMLVAGVAGLAAMRRRAG